MNIKLRQKATKELASSLGCDTEIAENILVGIAREIKAEREVIMECEIEMA